MRRANHERKYELTDDMLTIAGHTLYRIRAVRHFGDVRAGDLGGFVETDGNFHLGETTRLPNLSHDDDAWLYDDAKAYAGANVCGSGKMRGQSEIFGRLAIIGGSAEVAGHVVVDGLHCDGVGETRVSLLSRLDGFMEVRGRVFHNSDDTLIGEPKYRLTENTRTLGNERWNAGNSLGVSGVVVRQIQAMRDFQLGDGSWVRAGDLGGWVEAHRNLSHYNNAWIMDDAIAIGLAVVMRESLMRDRAVILDRAALSGGATMQDDALMLDQAQVGGEASISGFGLVGADTDMFEAARVMDNATVYGGQIAGRATIKDRAYIADCPQIGCNAVVMDDARVEGEASVYGNTVLRDNDVATGRDSYKLSQEQEGHRYVIIRDGQVSDEGLRFSEVLEHCFGEEGEDFSVRNGIFYRAPKAGWELKETPFRCDFEPPEEADAFVLAQALAEGLDPGVLVLTEDQYRIEKTNKALGRPSLLSPPAPDQEPDHPSAEGLSL